MQVKRNAYFSNLKSEIDTLKKKNHDLEHEVELLSTSPPPPTAQCHIPLERSINCALCSFALTENPPEPKEAHTDFAADFESGNIDFEKILEQVASDH